MVTDDMEVLGNKIDVERSYLLLHVNIIYCNASSGMSRNLINFLLCEGLIEGLQLERLNAILKDLCFKVFGLESSQYQKARLQKLKLLRNSKNIEDS